MLLTKATLAEVREMIVDHHYSGCVPQMPVHVFAWRNPGGLFGDTGEPVACAVYGVPVNRAWPKDALELQRLVRCVDGLPPLSAMLGASLRWLQEHDPRGFVLSYADTGHGHHGGVYQASGFTYVGAATANRRVGQYFEDADGRMLHGRAVGRMLGTTAMAKVAELRPDLTPSAGTIKHLYVRPLRQRLKPLLRRFGWSSQPFPKPNHAIRPLDEAVPAAASPKHPRGIAPIRLTPTDTSYSVLVMGQVDPQQMEVFMQRKTSRPMIGNPSVEYMNGFFSWQRGEDRDANPYRNGDKVSAARWQRGWSYAETHRAEG